MPPIPRDLSWLAADPGGRRDHGRARRAGPAGTGGAPTPVPVIPTTWSLGTIPVPLGDPRHPAVPGGLCEQRLLRHGGQRGHGRRQQHADRAVGRRALVDRHQPECCRAGESQLYGVSCAGPSFCVAVGVSGPGTTFVDPLVEQWDGHSWGIVNAVNPPVPRRHSSLPSRASRRCGARPSVTARTDRTTATRWSRRGTARHGRSPPRRLRWERRRPNSTPSPAPPRRGAWPSVATRTPAVTSFRWPRSGTERRGRSSPAPTRGREPAVSSTVCRVPEAVSAPPSASGTTDPSSRHSWRRGTGRRGRT